MCRTGFLLLLLPLLAACASRPAAPKLATAPIPALSYAAALDGGAVTPIQSPIVIKFAPYPTASFESLTRIVGADGAKTVSVSERITGTTFAEEETTGDLISIDFAVQNVTTAANGPDEEEKSLSIRGAKVILLVSKPSGPIKNINVFLQPPYGESALPEARAKELGRTFVTEVLPKTGLRQADNIPYHATYPDTDGNSGLSFDGKADVLGKGFYRGRPVVVLDMAGNISADGQTLGFDSYFFLDIATAIWIHREGVVRGNISVGGKFVRLSIHTIDDVRF